MSDNTIGRALRTRRALLGLDQRDAATRIGMSRTTYSSYERDTQRPSVDVLPAIADFLEISVDEVLVLFGASAIAAARTALGRLSSTERASTDASSEDVASHEIPHSDEMTGGYVNSNGNSHDHDVAEPTPAQPARTAKSKDSKVETQPKVHDEKEKGKKKKKKKEKREKLVNPAFASHV
jgi:transcriptional regulator with XRE-family HTH domain